MTLAIHIHGVSCLACLSLLMIKGDLYSIPGTPPSLYTDLKGDAFALRSDYAMQIDFEQKAPQFSVSETHWAKTWLLHEDAPKVENQL